MKKIYLSTLALLAAGTLSAQTKIDPAKVTVNNTPETVLINKAPTVIQANPNQTTGAALRPLTDRRETGYSFVKIGNTKYDLQSNASMGKRIILHADGTVSAVWTTANDNAFSTRGTGYNHFNGNTWHNVPSSSSTLRVENSRTGWPSIGILGSTEYVLGHDATTGGFIFSKNTAIGNQDFPSQQSVLVQSTDKPIWGRSASNGTNYIHVIANYTGPQAETDPPAPTINGVEAPMTYSRSSDGGQTWDIEHILLPGYDSTRWVTGSADNYAIDVQDSIVAIVTGRLGTDVALWKSTDNGTTFTHIIADSFPYAPFDPRKVLALDTPFCSDGTLEVLIDKEGKCHIWWGLTRVMNTDTTTDNISFFPGIAGLAYWNETEATAKLIANRTMFDRDGSGDLELQNGTVRSLENNNIPSGVASVARLGNTGVIRQPSAGIDIAGRLFVVFSVPVEGDIDPNLLDFREIYIMHSTDGGQTWRGPQALTKQLQKENDFPSIAKQVNDFVHLIYQQDDIPGTNLQNNSASSNNHPISSSGNDILYAAIPVQDILDSAIGNMWGVNVREVGIPSSLFVVSQNAPNPFSGQTDVTIYLNNFTPSIQVEIRDIMGKKIYTNQINNLNAGNHVITIDGSGFSSGIYFYTLTAGNNTVTRKMIVE